MEDLVVKGGIRKYFQSNHSSYINFNKVEKKINIICTRLNFNLSDRKVQGVFRK